MQKWLLSLTLGFSLIVGMIAAPAAVSAPVALTLPQSEAFAILGYDCGGIGETNYVTGFDPSTGYPTGDTYLITTCNAGGKGGHSSTHTAWAAVTWDFTSTVVSYSAATAPTVNPTFSAYDSNGNEIYNQSGSAYLVLAPGFAPPPNVTGISITAGPASGATSVTITGDGLTGATAVDFGTTPAASFIVNSDNSITAVSPAESAGTVDVSVTTAGGTSAAPQPFTFVGAPTISALTPNVGPVLGGNTVTITGTNLAAVTSVTFGDQGAAFNVNDDGSLSVTVPPSDSGPDSSSVTVTSLGGSATTQYTYANVAGLTATSVSPASGKTGITVTVHGTGFLSGATVIFGSLPSPKVTIVSSTQLRAIVPNGDATPANLIVTDSLGTAVSSGVFTPTFAIADVSPSAGAVGSTVEIDGVGFSPTSTVKFHGVAAPAVTYVSADELLVTVPSKATSGTVTVTNTVAPLGTAVSPSSFTVG